MKDYFQKQVIKLAGFLRREFPKDVLREEERGTDGRTAVELAMEILKRQKKELEDGTKHR